MLHLVLAAAAAAAVNYSPQWGACMETAHATRQVQHCNAEEITRQQAEIAKAFDAALALARRPGAKVRLQHDQTAWSAATDSKCGAIGRASRGSLASLKAQTCFLDANRDRLATLERLTHR
jgi:uncharacterized protein YecT (DUF1311 family)